MHDVESEPSGPGKWLVYSLGCAVFIGLVYFFMRFLDVPVKIAWLISVPGGIGAFAMFIEAAKATGFGPWDDGGA